MTSDGQRDLSRQMKELIHVTSGGCYLALSGLALVEDFQGSLGIFLRKLQRSSKVLHEKLLDGKAPGANMDRRGDGTLWRAKVRLVQRRRHCRRHEHKANSRMRSQQSPA